MANDFYSPSNAPVSGSSISSATIRNEFALIEDGFDKTSPLTGNADLPVFINSAATAQEAISASSARTKLGIAIGVNVQAYDTGLTSIAGLITGADEMVYTTALDTYAVTPFTAFARSILDDADEATFKATVNLEIGTDVQAYDATILKQSDVDDTPVNGVTTAPVSSNWAYDHAAAADPHPGYMLESNIGTGANNYLQLNASSQIPAVDGSLITGIRRNILIVEDQELSGTAGGASLEGVNTRVLNTVVYNEITGASLASNQITLPAGTYEINASAPCYEGTYHQIYLYNVTDAAEAKRGTSENSNATYYVINRSFLNTVFTITGTKVFELRHYITNAVAVHGLGLPTGQGTEVYATARIKQL